MCNLRNLFFLLALIAHLSSADLFSAEERKALKQLRERLKGVPFTEFESRDDHLITWLQAREMNVEAAAEMLYENLKWRRYNRIYSIANETILEFNPPPMLIEGLDKEGHPLMFFAPTHIDHRKLIIQGLRDKVVRYWFQLLEAGAAACRSAPKHANGHNVTKATAILDLHGYNLKQHFCTECVGVYREWFIGLEKYYPETVKHFVILNIPKVAKSLIDIIRPLLSPSVDRALKLFEADKKQYSSFLLKIIDADKLPTQYGGRKRIATLG